MSVPNPGGVQRECFPRKASVGVPNKITVTVVPTLASEWEITPDPIELHHDAHEVIWDLTELKKAYTTATDFKIKFTSVRPHVGKITLNEKQGPFPMPVGLSGGNLTVKGRGHEWGCYTYEIWVYYLDGEGHPIETAIDPQIDNLEPPPPPNPCRPDHPGGEGPGPKDR